MRLCGVIPQTSGHIKDPCSLMLPWYKGVLFYWFLVTTWLRADELNHLTILCQFCPYCVGVSFCIYTSFLEWKIYRGFPCITLTHSPAHTHTCNSLPLGHFYKKHFFMTELLLQGVKKNVQQVAFACNPATSSAPRKLWRSGPPVKITPSSEGVWGGRDVESKHSRSRWWLETYMQSNSANTDCSLIMMRWLALAAFLFISLQPRLYSVSVFVPMRRVGSSSVV